MAGFSVAMQQHDRITFARDQIMQPDPIDVGEFALGDLSSKASTSSDAIQMALRKTLIKLCFHSHSATHRLTFKKPIQ
jgi:hypothetical protein